MLRRENIDLLPSLPAFTVDALPNTGEEGVYHRFTVTGTEGDGAVDPIVYHLAFKALGRANDGLALGQFETEDGVLESCEHGSSVTNLGGRVKHKMAVSIGFEPMERFNPFDSLAKNCLQPDSANSP